jgi:hypothetical protein
MKINNINIEPKDVAVLNKISNITLEINELVVNKSVDIIVNLYDVDSKYISAVKYTISGDEYSSWGNDDEYLVNLICGKLGFVQLPEVLEQIPEELQ